MDNVRRVLDAGFVRLVDHMGDDASVVRSARVSYGIGSKGVDEDAKLINYMMRNGHTSPFEHVQFTFHVKCPLFVARQWQRHRTWSYNELSARYAPVREEFYIPEAHQVRLQSATNKQGSAEPMDAEAAALSVGDMEQVYSYAYETYKELIAAGVARELARSVLPVGMYTQFYGSVNLHNLLHFMELRQDEHAQYEIRVYANALEALIDQYVPVSLAAWRNRKGV
jgi:thymidylate synthase (FAD)